MVNGDKPDGTMYCLDIGPGFPDELRSADADKQKWRELAKTASSPEGLPDLTHVAPIPPMLDLERCISMPIFQVAGFLPILGLVYAFATGNWQFVGRAAVVIGGIHVAIFVGLRNADMKRSQFGWVSDNTLKYFSTKMVWPEELNYPNCTERKIFCIVPHGILPAAGVASGYFTGLFGGGLFRMVVAKFVTRMPIAGPVQRASGNIDASTQAINKALGQGENVGLILDGIAGMFESDHNTEKVFLKERKGIVKIALRQGAPLVPVYVFGHTSMYHVLQEPTGFTRWLSLKIQMPLMIALGRGGIPAGPARRVPMVIACGKPIRVPKIAEPSIEEINTWHAKLCEGVEEVFHTYKAAYGWSSKQIKIV